MQEKVNEGGDNLLAAMYKKVKQMSLICNLSGIVIDLAIVTYFVIAFMRINDYYIGDRTIQDRQDY